MVDSHRGVLELLRGVKAAGRHVSTKSWRSECVSELYSVVERVRETETRLHGVEVRAGAA